MSTLDAERQNYITAIFAPLNRQSAAKIWPSAGSLSSDLRKLKPTGVGGSVKLTPLQASCFGTAAVDMWLRSVHSFLISAALTNVSPVWASVAGYYSSHYAVRALAHLLGVFQLQQDARIVHLTMTAKTYVCTYQKKTSGDGEHKLYWRLVKEDPHFSGDPLFTRNTPAPQTLACDVDHRNFANYEDHVGPYPQFADIDKAAMKVRSRRISKIECTIPEIPSKRRYPDIDALQIVAYHRLVRFRRFLDEGLGRDNRFWTKHRQPSWVGDIVDFQLVDPAPMRSPG